MKNLALKNNRPFLTPQLVSQGNDVWGTSVEIPYWWRHTTQICIVLLIGWKFDSLVPPSRENQCWRREVSTVSQAKKAKYRNLISAVLWHLRYKEGCNRHEWQRAQEKPKLWEVCAKDEKKRKGVPGTKWGGEGEEGGEGSETCQQSTGKV